MCVSDSWSEQSSFFLHRDLDLKGIIYEAYEQGRMIAVLPFVNKVHFLTSHPKMQLEHSNSLFARRIYNFLAYNRVVLAGQ